MIPFDMKLLTTLALLYVTAGDALAENPEDNVLEKSAPLVQDFAKHLTSELQKAMTAGGPAGAITICKTESAKAERDFREKDPTLLRVRRVSLKTRNPKTHTPTGEEREWLQAAEEKLQKGEEPTPAVLRGATSVTALVPIRIVNAICLQCHGDLSTFSRELQSALSEHYPEDRATGYAMGDLRGAFAIEWRKPD